MHFSTKFQTVATILLVGCEAYSAYDTSPNGDGLGGGEVLSYHPYNRGQEVMISSDK